jgi:hypothetical protein
MPAYLRQTACKVHVSDISDRLLHAGYLPFGANFFSYRNFELGFGNIYHLIESIRS